MESDEQNLLVLSELRKMNCLQREDMKSIDNMCDQIAYFQDLFDTVIVNNKNTNQSIIREIRVNLIRLSILANPTIRTLYRNVNETNQSNFLSKQAFYPIPVNSLHAMN